MRIITLLLLSLVLYPQNAAAQTPTEQELESIVSSRVCPANPTRYKRMTYKEGCGEGFESVKREMVECTRRIDAINRRIRAYNSFIDQCSRQRKAATIESKKNGGWAERLKQAESRNQSRDDVNSQNEQSFDTQVKQSREDAAKQQAEWAKQYHREEAAREKQERDSQRRAKAQYERDLKQLKQRQARERSKIVQKPSVIGGADGGSSKRRIWCATESAYLYGPFGSSGAYCTDPNGRSGCFSNRGVVDDVCG